jgi:hypothetical protein
MELFMSHLLSIRNTRRYADAWRDLDDWTDIGSAKVISSHTIEIEEDPEYDEIFRVVEVDLDQPEPLKIVCQALDATYTNFSCTHDWDCCGCRWYRVQTTTHIEGNRYLVALTSGRNY